MEIIHQVVINIIVALISAFLGFCARTIWDWFRRLRIKAKNQTTTHNYEKWILPLDAPVVPYYGENNANLILTKKRFVFEIPKEKRAQLEAQTNLKGEAMFAIHKPAKLDGDNRELYAFLKKYYKQEFPNDIVIEAFLQRVICSTVDYFLERLKQGKLAFNNKQIGIDRIDINRKGKDHGRGGEEDPTLDISLYETDYFTAQVMVHVYQHLCQLDAQYKEKNQFYKSPFERIDKEMLNNEMRAFMSSLGVGGYILFDRGEELEYWVVKRSDNVRNGSNKNMVLRSYSFDETMDLRDGCNDIMGGVAISAYAGADRALQEELGLFSQKDERVKGNIGKFHLTNIVLIRTDDPKNARFEMQLLGYTFLYFNKQFRYEDLILKKKNAKDSSFEAVEVYPQHLRDELIATTNSYTHTPEAVYYAETLRNMEDMRVLSTIYRQENEK